MAVWTLIDSPAGGVGIASTAQGVCRIAVGTAPRTFAAQLKREFPGRVWRRSDADPAFEEVIRQIGEYFRGERREFDLPASQEGTPFQQAVWRAVRAIPWGQTASYGEVAARAGRPGAARAVGNAMNLCGLGLVVPCHRVVAAAGVGGWGGDDRVKRWLLRFEGAAVISGPEPAARPERAEAAERRAPPSRSTSRRR